MDSIGAFAQKIEQQRYHHAHEWAYGEEEKWQIQAYIMNKSIWTQEERETLKKYHYLEEMYEMVMQGVFVDEIVPALQVRWATEIATEVSLDICLSFDLSNIDGLLAIQSKIEPTLNVINLEKWLLWVKDMSSKSDALDHFIQRYVHLHTIHSEREGKEEALFFSLHQYHVQKSYHPITSLWLMFKSLEILGTYTQSDGRYRIMNAMCHRHGLQDWHNEIIRMIITYDSTQYSQYAFIKKNIIEWLPQSSYGHFQDMCREKKIFKYYEWPLTYRLLEGQLKRLASVLGDSPYPPEMKICDIIPHIRHKNTTSEVTIYL